MTTIDEGAHALARELSAIVGRMAHDRMLTSSQIIDGLTAATAAAITATYGHHAHAVAITKAALLMEITQGQHQPRAH